MSFSNINETNVIAVTFARDDEAYAALARLKQLDSEGMIELRGAQVVTREADGKVVVKESEALEEGVGLASGGIIGLLVGVLGGPVGILIGGVAGALAGSIVDVSDADDIESVLASIARLVQTGHNTLLADVREPSDHEVVDAVMKTRTGTVLRRDLHEVETEIAAAEEARREASRQARKRLRDERHEKEKANVDAKLAELKAKLPHHQAKGGEHRSKEPAGSPS